MTKRQLQARLEFLIENTTEWHRCLPRLPWSNYKVKAVSGSEAHLFDGDGTLVHKVTVDDDGNYHVH